MKKLTKISIITLLTLFISNCGDKVREEITEMYNNGNKKLLVKYKGEGSDEVVVEKITYSVNDDTLILEKPLEKMKMEREYHENGQIGSDGNYKDGKLDGKWTFYYENGQIREEGNFKDGEPDGKWTTYNEDGSVKVPVNGETLIDRGDLLYELNGQKPYTGDVFELYKDGGRKLGGSIKCGMKNKLWIYYHENGQ